MINDPSSPVITTYIFDYIFPLNIKGIESFLTEKGYSLTLVCTDNNVEKERQCLQSMLNRNVDGLIIDPTKSSSFNPNINYYLESEQINIPYLMINQFYTELTPPHLVVNDEKGGYLATKHLIELGHNQIVGVFKTDDLQDVHRLQGYVQAFRESNIALVPDLIVNFSTEGQDAILLNKIRKLWLSTKTKPTGIICYNVQIALSVLNLFREIDVNVPTDISMVGFDDSSLAEATETKLTSLSHPKTEMGKDAAKWIVSAVEKRSTKGNGRNSIIYEPELVIRNSTAPINL